MTLMVSFILTGCVSRKQADEKLARGCAAGAEIFMTDGFKVKSIKQSTFAESAEEGKGYRAVNLTTVVSDGWADVDKEIKCIFSEGFGFMGANYSAQIHQLKFDDKVFGKEGKEIIGSYEENLKLTETVDKALME